MQKPIIPGPSPSPCPGPVQGEWAINCRSLIGAQTVVDLRLSVVLADDL